jgi:type IV pilus assembly protein PilW
MNEQRQQGATLIELLISVAIGLIIAASMLGMYVTSTANSSQILKSSKLNQELASLATVMVNDIRRAGISAAGGGLSDPSDYIAYPESSVFKEVSVKNDGKCIIYSYDADLDGDITAPDGFNLYGFFLAEDAVVYMLENHSSNEYTGDCTLSDNWKPLTDPNTVVINKLEFNLTTECVNADNEAAGCTGASSGDFLVTAKRVDFNLQGALASDSSVVRNVGTSDDPVHVLIRNDQIDRVPET